MFSGKSYASLPIESSRWQEKWAYFLFAGPLLLFIPVLYYSLTTPFALVDDYGMCYYVEFLDNTSRFQKWFQTQIVDFSYGRYRPVFDLYNMVTWKVFGASPWLHHLARWVLHFGAIICFASAFLKFRDSGNDALYPEIQTRGTYYYLIPLAILVYVWLFFPNSPASRLGPQEVHTVFFLGLCSLIMALIVKVDGKESTAVSAIVTHAVLYIAYLGLSWSKEINIAPMLWILIFYYGLQLRGFSWGRIIGGVPLLIIFVYTTGNIYTASRNSPYGVAPVTPELLKNNAAWMVRELFQFETSPIITAGFIVLSIGLIFWILLRILKREITGELLFVIFLLGQFASLYLILCTSWAPVLRYWYILIPSFTTLLAFSARFILRAARKHDQKIRFLPTLLLISLLVFFIGSNYYNSLLQTIAQHSLRRAEADLIGEIGELHDQGNHVQILKIKNDPEAELVAHLIAYFHRFSPRFHERKYRVYENKPAGEAAPYYVVTMHEQPGSPEIHKTIEANRDYWLLVHSYRVAEKFQGKHPYLSKDAGVHLLDNYRWIIYKKTTGGPS